MYMTLASVPEQAVLHSAAALRLRTRVKGIPATAATCRAPETGAGEPRKDSPKDISRMTPHLEKPI